MSKVGISRTDEADNLVVTLGAVLFVLLFFGGGLVGGAIDPNLGSLIGLLVGLLLWIVVYGLLEWLLRPHHDDEEEDAHDEH